MKPLSRAELIHLAAISPTDVPTAGRAWGLGANAAYDLVNRGEFPCRVVRLGKKLRVPVADLPACLGIDPDFTRADDGAISKRQPEVPAALSASC
jgi:hypothetical protein